MELKLQIYNKEMTEVVKTYKTETFNISLGTVEDLLNLIDVDTFMNGSDSELIKAALKLVTKGFGPVKDLLKTVFVGLTDDEIRCINTREIISVIVNIVKYSMGEFSLLTNSKN